eukprot:m.476197 g.476197  ORF g.476197 m.476197 type:complete len:460 (+) comp20466_c0_seq1:304-1683(+)
MASSFLPFSAPTMASAAPTSCFAGKSLLPDALKVPASFLTPPNSRTASPTQMLEQAYLKVSQQLGGESGVAPMHVVPAVVPSPPPSSMLAAPVAHHAPHHDPTLSSAPFAAASVMGAGGAQQCQFDEMVSMLQDHTWNSPPASGRASPTWSVHSLFEDDAYGASDLLDDVASSPGSAFAVPMLDDDLVGSCVSATPSPSDSGNDSSSSDAAGDNMLCDGLGPQAAASAPVFPLLGGPPMFAGLATHQQQQQQHHHTLVPVPESDEDEDEAMGSFFNTDDTESNASDSDDDESSNSQAVYVQQQQQQPSSSRQQRQRRPPAPVVSSDDEYVPGKRAAKTTRRRKRSATATTSPRTSGATSAPYRTTKRPRNKRAAALSKRDSHNVSERMRRQDLKTGFDLLRETVPTVAAAPRAHTGAILKAAIDHILELQREERELLQAKAALIAENKRLLKRAQRSSR